jgi:hypothetical protein
VYSVHSIFCGTGVWIQGFGLARQVLYFLSHYASSFCSGYIWDRVSLFAKAGLDHNPPIFCFLP